MEFWGGKRVAMPLVALVTAAIVAVGVYSFIGLQRQERARRQGAGQSGQ